MVRVRLVATLRSEAGIDEIEINGSGMLMDILAEARRKIPVLRRVIGEEGEPKPTALILVDDVDYRLLGKKLRIGRDSVITIIPVIHGG